MRNFSSIIIGLAVAHAHLLAEPKERHTQQGNRHAEEYASTVAMLHPQEGTANATNNNRAVHIRLASASRVA